MNDVRARIHLHETGLGEYIEWQHHGLTIRLLWDFTLLIEELWDRLLVAAQNVRGPRYVDQTSITVLRTRIAKYLGISVENLSEDQIEAFIEELRQYANSQPGLEEQGRYIEWLPNRSNPNIILRWNKDTPFDQLGLAKP